MIWSNAQGRRNVEHGGMASDLKTRHDFSDLAHRGRSKLKAATKFKTIAKLKDRHTTQGHHKHRRSPQNTRSSKQKSRTPHNTREHAHEWIRGLRQTKAAGEKQNATKKKRGKKNKGERQKKKKKRRQKKKWKQKWDKMWRNTKEPKQMARTFWNKLLNCSFFNSYFKFGNKTHSKK